ncbi:DNA-binding protein [Flaviflexus salsibiostraticola]|uniref:DNA-binding protein n=2 Tax=Flaviflexus salsibiostraticola TaxID=1282737 RepID=A0A3S8Z7U0_9ACTO|nr:DNA-binding protein [Flaviflexus salsibiostraticola]
MTMTNIHQPGERAVHHDAPRLYTLDEAGQVLRVSKWTVQRLIQRELLGSVKVGVRTLVPAEDIERYIAEQSTGRIRGGFHG